MLRTKERINLFFQPLICIILCVISNNTISQSTLKVGLGLSLNTTEHREPTSASLDLGLKYYVKPIEIELRIDQAIKKFGAKNSEITYIPNNGDLIPYKLTSSSSVLDNISSAQLYLNYRPKPELKRAYIGLGYGVFNISERELIIKERQFNAFTQTIKSDIFSAISFKIGIPFKNLDFSSFIHFTNYDTRDFLPRDMEAIYGHSFKYFFNSTNEVDFDYSIAKDRIFSFQVGTSLVFLLNNKAATATRYFLLLNYPVNKDYQITVSYEHTGDSHGVNEDQVRTELERDPNSNSRRSDRASLISVYKLGALKTGSLANFSNFYYGLGLGLYNTPRLGILSGNLIPAQNKIGPFFTIGIGSTIYNANLDINLPLSGIPVSIGLRTGINININKRKKRKSSAIEHDIIRRTGES